jgi:hypothetical protein
MTDSGSRIKQFWSGFKSGFLILPRLFRSEPFAAVLLIIVVVLSPFLKLAQVIRDD